MAASTPIAADSISIVVTDVEKAFLLASIDLKIAQVKRQVNTEADPTIKQMRLEHVTVLNALAQKVRSSIKL